MGDQFGFTNAIGLAIVIAGVVLFNVYKLQKIKKAGACIPHGVTCLGMGIPDTTFSTLFFLQGEIVMKVAVGRGGKSEADSDAGTAGDTEMQPLLKVDAQAGGDANNEGGGASLVAAGNGSRSGGISPPRQKLTLS